MNCCINEIHLMKCQPMEVIICADAIYRSVAHARLIVHKGLCIYLADLTRQQKPIHWHLLFIYIRQVLKSKTLFQVTIKHKRIMRTYSLLSWTINILHNFKLLYSNSIIDLLQFISKAYYINYRFCHCYI